MENNVVVKQQNGVIQCNFEEMKAYLQNRLAQYDGVLFTEDTKADAKKTVANLRKEKKALIDRVKEVKEEYMKPFNEFYAEAVEVIEMYDKPINFINEQVEEYEKKRIEEKKAYIKELYDEFVGNSDVAEYLPLEKIYNPKWENATTNRKAICTELTNYVDNARLAVASIKAMHSDAEEIALKMYKETLDTTKCILYINDHEKTKAEILAREQERVRREEEERIRREERERIEAERKAQEEKEAIIQVAQEEIQKAREEAIEAFIPSVEGEANLYEYRISLTADAKAKLEMFMDSIGVEWEEM
jgi:hypothetical protein